jgi:hypothetical protein
MRALVFGLPEAAADILSWCCGSWHWSGQIILDRNLSVNQNFCDGRGGNLVDGASCCCATFAFGLKDNNGSERWRVFPQAALPLHEERNPLVV